MCNSMDCAVDCPMHQTTNFWLSRHDTLAIKNAMPLIVTLAAQRWQLCTCDCLARARRAVQSINTNPHAPGALS